MTLEEKVAQTLGIWKGKEKITDAAGQFDPAGARALIANGIGQIARPTELRDKPTKILLGPREDAVFVNAMQKWLIENTRLGIPVDVPRGGAARPGRAQGHELPRADRRSPARGIRRSSSG